MTIDTAALVLAMPGESVEAIIEKLRLTGSRSLQLLVPDGVIALQNLGGVEQLRRFIAVGGIDLVLITSDQATLNAAQMGDLATLSVQGAQVRAPSAPPVATVQPSPYATRRLPESGPKRPPPVPSEALDDDALLRELEALYAVPPPAAPPTVVLLPVAVPPPITPLAPPAAAAKPAQSDEDFFAALDDLSETINTGTGSASAPVGYDDFASELDAWGETTSQSPTPARSEPARPRVRPEDIALSADEVRRAGVSARRTAPAPARPAPRPVARPMPAPTPSRRSPVDEDDYDDDEFEAAPRRSWLLPAIILGLIALLALIGAVILLGNQAEVQVSLSITNEAIAPFSQLAIPLVAPGQASTTAVVAQQVSADVPFSANGTVTEATQAPSASAAGPILILSLNAQPFSFPAGVEFIAIKADGQEVRFVSEAPIDVPPASTSDQGAQIVTTRGQVQVNIVARAPGSASNIEPNTIRQMLVPGQPPIDVTGGNLVVRHDPIGGGAEQEIRIVKESDVQRLLGEALAGLDNRARQVLEEQLASQGDLGLEVSTISPTTADLNALRGFEFATTPAVGQPVDPANPTFNLSVQARYSALATPKNNPLTKQIGEVAPEQLSIAGLLRLNACQSPQVNSWLWDGSRLTVDGQVGPDTSPACVDKQLNPATIQRVKDAVRGKPQAEAELALQNLVSEGLIASFQLPAMASLPGWDNQISVTVNTP